MQPWRTATPRAHPPAVVTHQKCPFRNEEKIQASCEANLDAWRNHFEQTTKLSTQPARLPCVLFPMNGLPYMVQKLWSLFSNLDSDFETRHRKGWQSKEIYALCWQKVPLNLAYQVRWNRPWGSRPRLEFGTVCLHCQHRPPPFRGLTGCPGTPTNWHNRKSIAWKRKTGFTQHQVFRCQNAANENEPFPTGDLFSG